MVYMARGRKHYTLEEKLEKLNEKIATVDANLVSLKEEKAKLVKEIEDNQLRELNKIIQDSGMTIDEIKDLLEKK